MKVIVESPRISEGRDLYKNIVNVEIIPCTNATILYLTDTKGIEARRSYSTQAKIKIEK